jgi:molybdenum cofactor cytidylyltransferase
VRIGAVILAAGSASRFGGAKLAAPLDGRPLLRHVVDAARTAGLDPIIVVVAPGDSLAAVNLGAVTRVTNPDPAEGLSSSVRIGLRALDADAAETVDAAIILPGDQPRVRPEVIRRLVDAAGESPATPFVVARHAGDGVPNPILAHRPIWRLADELAGDRGFGPVLATHPELVRVVDVEGTNPDVDTQADLARLVEADSSPGDVS